MNSSADCTQDVMQVCWNGHVITDLLRSGPEQSLTHCDRCGAATLEFCPVCGRDLPGAIVVPGMQPVGSRRPPDHCPTCGGAFPWAQRSPVPVADPLARLENLLRRLPRVIRQLRSRQGDRPPFRVVDARDLEDLLRALLPIEFDDVRPERRTPHYAPLPTTDFLLAQERLALTIRFTGRDARLDRLMEELQEDATYYRQQPGYHTLVAFFYDPEGLLPNPALVERTCSKREGEFETLCVIGVP
jgi:rRNA maturation protein Nop10